MSFSIFQIEQIQSGADPREGSRDTESEIENENDEVPVTEALETPVSLDGTNNLGTDAISPKQEGYTFLANHPLETVTRDFWMSCILILRQRSNRYPSFQPGSDRFRWARSFYSGRVRE